MAYPYKGVAPALNTLLAQLNALAPNRSKLSDGALGDPAHAARVSFHNPDVNGIVRARDFTHDPAGGLDCNWLANSLTASGDPRILEIIWNRRYWTPKGGWVPYVGTNPHDKHLHLSVNGAPLYNSTAPWNLGANPEEDEIMAAADDIKAMLQDIINRVGGLQYATFPETGGGSQGEFVKRIRNIDATVAALAARDPKVTIDAEAIAAAIPDELAEQVVTKLAEKLAARPAS